MPNFSGPDNASPESLTITRRYFGFVIEPLAVDHSGYRIRAPPPATDGAKIPSMRPGKSGDFAAEIAAGSVDAFAQGIADETAELNRSADLTFGLFKRLGYGLLVVENERLLDQTNFLVESLQSRLDDLLDDIRGFALRLGLVRQYALLAFDRGRVEAGRIDRLRIGGCDVHGHHAADRLELIGIAGRLQRHNDADAAEAVGHRTMHVASHYPFADRKSCGPAQRHVLADLGDGISNGVRDFDVADRCREDRVDVGTGIDRRAGNHLHQALKQVVAGDEIGLG